MPKFTIQIVIKNAGKIKGKGKAASATCGLQTSTRNRSVTMIQTESHLTLWIAIKDAFLLAEQPFRPKL
jgi:hypothetical protein